MENNEEKTHEAKLTDDELARRIDIANKQVKMLMDELKKVFAPHMLLTFFVRDPKDPSCFSLLTEEADLRSVINHLSALPNPKAIPQVEVGNA